jgi:hypothetical protein
MYNLEMWPNQTARAAIAQEVLEKAKKMLDSREGRESLEAILRRQRATLDKLRRDSAIDPAILKEPMTF